MGGTAVRERDGRVPSRGHRRGGGVAQFGKHAVGRRGERRERIPPLQRRARRGQLRPGDRHRGLVVGGAPKGVVGAGTVGAGAVTGAGASPGSGAGVA